MGLTQIAAVVENRTAPITNPNLNRSLNPNLNRSPINIRTLVKMPKARKSLENVSDARNNATTELMMEM
jgi:hypothetical protein